MEKFEGLVAARPEEQAGLRELSRHLARDDQTARYFFADSDCNRLEIPPSALRILARAIRDLSQGRSVTVVHCESDLTTGQAAAFLNVSRPHLIKLVDEGKVPYHMVGKHRRIRVGDLVQFKQGRDEERRRALAQLRRVSERLGLYDQ